MAIVTTMLWRCWWKCWSIPTMVPFASCLMPVPIYISISHHHSFSGYFIHTNRQLRSKDISKFHIQLCMSLGGMLIVFVAGFDKTGNQAGCITVGVLIHYFTLVAWMWMGAEALLMFKKVVLVFGEVSFCFVLFVSLICWGKYNMHKHRFTYSIFICMIFA